MPGMLKKSVIAIVILITVEWLARDKQHALERISMKWCWRWSVYYALILAILFLSGVRATFIYFQF